MSGPRHADRFADEVMERLARQERRLPAVIAALCAAALVLAVPALLVLLGRPALDAVVQLGLLAVREVLADLLGNPVFWVAVGLGALWLGWLVVVGVRGRR